MLGYGSIVVLEDRGGEAPLFVDNRVTIGGLPKRWLADGNRWLADGNRWHWLRTLMMRNTMGNRSSWLLCARHDFRGAR